MPGLDGSYPPQFAESCVAGVVGQINDFAGGYESGGFDNIAAPLPGAKGLPTSTDPAGVPVVVTGFKTPAGESLPGLREALIASAIIKLVAQIPPSNPLREELRASAMKLYAVGGEKISDYGKSGGATPGKPAGGTTSTPPDNGRGKKAKK